MMYVVCFFMGAFIGALMMCLCVAAKRGDGE
jgi:hypothetical protein